VNLKNTISIEAIIDDTKLFTKVVEKENIYNSARVKVVWRISEVCLFSGCHRTFVAMHMNRRFSRTNILDMNRISEEVNSRMTIKKDQLRANGSAQHGWSIVINILSQQKGGVGDVVVNFC
jgi:hypothetical protein